MEVPGVPGTSSHTHLPTNALMVEGTSRQHVVCI